MRSKLYKRNLSQLYLTLVPILTVVFGLGVGYISYRIYLPIWLLNVVLMIVATWVLGAHVIKTVDEEKKHIAACALCFIVPTMLSSMFAGLGAPPYESPKLWVSSATEQDAPIDQAFNYIAPIYLPHIFPGAGLIPGITNTSINEGWNKAGLNRTVYFSDGSTSQETMLTHNGPNSFLTRTITLLLPFWVR